MELKNNRFWCYSNESIFYIDEMINSLHTRTSVPREVVEAMISAWINLVRFEVLQFADHNQAFSLSLREGKGVIYLKKFLIPQEWTRDSFGKHIARRTGSSFNTVCTTFQAMGEILSNLNCRKAFEPIGWLDVVSKADGGGFKVYLWDDFPQPDSYRFEEESTSVQRQYEMP